MEERLKSNSCRMNERTDGTKNNPALMHDSVQNPCSLMVVFGIPSSVRKLEILSRWSP
jgi:hypothetical protein